MRRSVQKLTLGIIILLSAFVSYAQVTPVQVTPQLVAPYSLQVSEYYSGTLPKIQVLLINRDINQPTIQVKLKMTIESQNCRLRTKDVNTTPTITLTNGVPYYLAPNELQAYFSSANLDFGGGMSEQQYNQTGRLPEGLYTFTFEAYELYSSNLVSNKGFSMGWLTLADPPLLNTPARGEEVTPNATQSIVFNWTPRHNTSPAAAYMTEYQFTLVEYNDAALSPDAAFASSNPILQKTVTTTTMLFSNQESITTNLVEGKRYAWRVQAKAKNGALEIPMFRNNGFSEVFWFVYKNSCTAPQAVTVNVQGQRATIEWQNNPQHLEWKVEYREYNNPKAEWFTLTNALPRVVIMDLKPSTQYEYRVGGACYVNQFTYTTMNYFSTASGPVPPVVNCGDSTYPALGVAGLQTLNPGDTIRAGSFIVNVGYSTGTGSFTGTGYVKVPWLMNAKVEVRFTNITVSTDYKLVSGLIETTYDPTESGIDDIDEYVDIFKAGFGVGDVITGDITADKTVDFIVQWPNGIGVTLPPNYNNETGQGSGPVTISLTPQGGGAATTYTVDKLPTTIKDKDGNLYQVYKAGNISQIGKAGGGELLKTLNTKVIDKDKAEVKFVDYPTKQVYAFDAWYEVYKKSSTFSKEYERIGDYYVSQKAIAPGQTDYLKAVVTITDQTIVPDSIKFVNGKGTIYKSTSLGNNTYEIAIVGGPEKDAQEIYAVYKQSSSKNLNLGKVKVSSYPRKEYEIDLIPVNSDISDLQLLNDSVNRIYNAYNIYFNINKQTPFTDTLWDVNRNGKMDLEGDVFMGSYSREMSILKNNFVRSKGSDPNKAYLFILTSAEDNNINGEMPRGKKFGVLFTNNPLSKAVLISHELGHGLFSLRHTFDGYGLVKNELPENLLDYSSGKTLSKYQWDLLHDPAIVLGLLDSDEDSRSAVVKSIPAEFLNSDQSTYTFITYGGQSINIPKEASDFVFHFGVLSFDGSQHLVTGVLQEFKLNSLTYTIDFSGGISYKTSGGAVYQNINLPFSETNVIMAMPNEESLSLYKFNVSNLPKYNHSLKVNSVEEKDFSVLPFSSTNLPLKNNASKIIEYKLPKQPSGEQWRYDKNIYEIVHGFSYKPELIYISKIAQLRRAYDTYFNEFTSINDDWYYPKKITTSTIDGNTIISSDEYRPGVWGAKIDATNSPLPAIYSSNKVEYFKKMLEEFRGYIVVENSARGTFFDTVSVKADLQKVIKYVNSLSEFECTNLAFEKVKIVLEVLVKGFEGNWLVVRSNDHQKAIVKILKTVKPQYYSEMLTFLSDVNTLPLLEKYLENKSKDENYYSQYVDAVRQYLANVEKPTTNQIIAEGNVYQHLNKGFDHYTKISFEGLEDATPEVKFFYQTKAPYVPANSTDVEHNGHFKLGYFSYLLLKLDDDFTFENKVVFAKKDYPNGIALSGIELYWLKKEQYEILSSRFTTFMLAGTAMVVSGPELAVAKGWRLILAVADFQAAAKTFATVTPQYQQLIAGNSNLAAYFNAWDEFNKVYGVCRITQAVGEIAITKWASVKSAAGNVKNDASISASIKNELKIEEIVVGGGGQNLINSLKGKLTEAGYSTLQTWKTGKTISFVDEYGSTLSGVEAETKLFTELDSKIGTNKVLGTFNDGQGRFLVQCEGINRNTVYSVLKNKDGNFIVYEFKPTYKPSANTQVNAGLSEYKLAPDYTKNLSGGVSDEYLCPAALLPPNKSPIVRIKMTGKRTGSNGDFYNANQELGRADLGDKAITNYVWHHLDDMEIINGEAWCTMQLVRQDAHMKAGLQGMTHSGSPAQWTAYFGIAYK